MSVDGTKWGCSTEDDPFGVCTVIPSPCDPNGSCLPSSDKLAAVCSCNEGFEVEVMPTHTCVDINECSGNPCVDPEEWCINTVGDHTCSTEIDPYEVRYPIFIDNFLVEVF